MLTDKEVDDTLILSMKQAVIIPPKQISIEEEPFNESQFINETFFVFESLPKSGFSYICHQLTSTSNQYVF